MARKKGAVGRYRKDNAICGYCRVSLSITGFDSGLCPRCDEPLRITGKVPYRGRKAVEFKSHLAK